MKIIDLIPNVVQAAIVSAVILVLGSVIEYLNTDATALAWEYSPFAAVLLGLIIKSINVYATTPRRADKNTGSTTDSETDRTSSLRSVSQTVRVQDDPDPASVKSMLRRIFIGK